MNILIACEYSGRVRDAFLALGHNAVSCDILPTEAPGPHIRDDVLKHLDDGWDMMIAHPECTYLTCSAEWAYNDHQKKRIKPGTLVGAARRSAREHAFRFFMDLAKANIEKICLENPVGVVSSFWRKPDQIIQPYEFGEDASKKTCLWLKNLPLLKPTEYVEPRIINGKKRWANQTDSGQNRLPPSDTRGKDRSLTYLGIAKAMAEQWG